MGGGEAVLTSSLQLFVQSHLKEVVPHALDSISLTKIRQFSRRSARYMSAYELGLSGKAAVFAVKRYRSYRRVPETVLEEFGNM